MAALVAGTPSAPAAAQPPPNAATAAGADAPVLLVRPDKPGPTVSPLVTGVNNDQWFGDSLGLYDPGTNSTAALAEQRTTQAGAGIVRYPGGTPGQLFRWERAIGPQSSRGCQTNGSGAGASVDSRYGVDEHMAFVARAGAQASMMVNFVTATPDEDADLVEYLNAPLGTNPNGGTAWAEVRAANGHPQPYDVHEFEVGNELDRTAERYWMSQDTETALREYAFGGSEPQVDQQAGKGCDFTASKATASDGTAGQTFAVKYPPVQAGSAHVRVGTASSGTAWTQVDDLAAAGPGDKVFTLDNSTGLITFGDGRHGAVPPAGQHVYVDYVSGPHAGFLERYRAMKAADPDIDVCATWAPITADTGLGAPGFPELMAAHGVGDQYDCLAVHPYTNFKRMFGDAFPSAVQGHAWFMIGEQQAANTLAAHVAAVRANAPASTYVTTSEFGALFFGAHDESQYPSWQTAMSHSLYMASQWVRLLDLGVPWAEGNTLISETPDGLRGMLGGAPAFVYTGDAVVRESLRPVVQGGGHVVSHTIIQDPQVLADPTAYGNSYQSLLMTATVDEHGELHVVVVNRDPEKAVTATVVPAGFPHAATVSVATVAGSNTDPARAGFESFNSIDHPDEVRVQSGSVEAGHGAFRYTFPAHSVTILGIPRR